ncbi:MAG: DEAD/DEAH box helicase family protein [Lachnospiraceae bacterium]|nr:DEAD/DEAH box helicase family protein [Lachnospiraceae bacterium]
MSDIEFSQYTTDYIAGVMSLREPQKESLKRLEQITEAVTLNKNTDLEKALECVRGMFPTCSAFERSFLSVTFALATGVGKTRLMGAFITYLYTQKGIKNFFVVAPGTTVYEKLKNDLGNPSNAKYVFKGLGCFSLPPRVITDEEYSSRNLYAFDTDIHIYIFNIDKFNKENVNMRKEDEYFGGSFLQSLADLDDLILLMDESHHYRAQKGTQALDELRPVLGLELTATPLVKAGTKQIPFKNVIYEYPLSKAIEDGYTRTPYAITRSDIDFFHFGNEALDKLMLQDGIAQHEKTKQCLEEYALSHDKDKVKPFVLVVCSDTDHAAWVENYIKSDEFKSGKYKNKVITVHSKKSGAESDFNTRLLLGVEQADNPVEIVIHVNMLKEGWDVNNLYTIVPLRTAASKILREQMVGRGLRLPYGKRTGDKAVDAVMLTAHDKFEEILEEAQKGDSIFKKGNIINLDKEEEEETVYTQLSFNIEENRNLDSAYEYTKIEKTQETDAVLKQVTEKIYEKISEQIQTSSCHVVTEEDEKTIAQCVKKELAEDVDLGETFRKNADPISAWTDYQTKEIHRAVVDKYIPIPKIKVSDNGVVDYIYEDFDLDLGKFTQTPIDNQLLIQNLEDPSDLQRVRGDKIDFGAYEPKKVILEQIRMQPEVDYEKCSELLYKLITQVCDYFENRFGQNGMQNIVMMNKVSIGKEIYEQLLQHFKVTTGFLEEEVIDVVNYNVRPKYHGTYKLNLFATFETRIQNIIFTGIKKGVFEEAKFDSEPELVLARVLEQDNDVKNWLRPASTQFNITYNHGHRYEPDFVVEAEDVIYLVEVKGEDRIDDADVIAKKERAIRYCKAVSAWGKASGYKKWQYLFIPAGEVHANSSFGQLAKRFIDCI